MKNFLKPMFCVVLVLSIILVARQAAANGYYPKFKYFLAKADFQRNTIIIYFNGSFFYQGVDMTGRNNPNLNKFGVPFTNPTNEFEQGFARASISGSPCKINKAVDGISWHGGYIAHIIDCESDFIKRLTGLDIGDRFVVIKPTKSGKGARVEVSIEKFYYSPGNEDYGSCLLAESSKINSLEDFTTGWLIASYLQFERGTGGRSFFEVERVLPPKVEKEYKRLSEKMKVEKEDFRNKYVANNKLSRSDASVDEFMKTEDFEVIVQPVLINTGKLKNTTRYLMTSFRGSKNYTAETIFLDANGNKFPPPALFTDGILTNCLGVVRTIGPFGSEDLVLYEKDLGAYCRGISLLRYDEGGNLNEILFMVTELD